MKYNNLYFAQAYGEGAYSSGTYSCTTAQQAAGTCSPGGGSNNSGGLADTGITVAIFVTLACFIVFLSILVRVWRRTQRQPVMQEVNVENETSNVDKTVRSS